MKNSPRCAQFIAIAIISILLAPGFCLTSTLAASQESAVKKRPAQQRPEARKVPRGQENKEPVPPEVLPTPDINADPNEPSENDADRPPFANGLVNHAEYLRRRQEWVSWKVGMEPGKPYNPEIRQAAIRQMTQQEATIESRVREGRISPRVLSTGWTNIGPFPIPNGQTQSFENPVSGRTIYIAIHPTNPDIVYVGTAQGGLYRTVNGGQTWTQLFDSADSQVIGAIAIAPSNPEIVYVGTGENGQCGSGWYAGG